MKTAMRVMMVAVAAMSEQQKKIAHVPLFSITFSLAIVIVDDDDNFPTKCTKIIH